MSKYYKSILFVIVSVAVILLVVISVRPQARENGGVVKHEVVNTFSHKDQQQGTPARVNDTGQGAPIKSDDNVTKGWKVYKNDKYQFSFKYPVNWDIDGDPHSDGGLVLRDTKESLVQLIVFVDVGESLSLQEREQQNRKGGLVESTGIISVSGSHALETAYKGGQDAGGPASNEIFFVRNGVPYVFIFDTASETSLQTEKRLLESVVFF